MDQTRQRARRYLRADDEHGCFDACGGCVDLYIDLVMRATGSLEQAGAKCRFCGKNTAVVQLLQTRAADEGMTAIATCNACKKRYTV